MLEPKRRRKKPGPRPKDRAKDKHSVAGEDLKKKILDVAINLFAEHGFADTRIKDIASAAGAEPPTIYHYFGDKHSLYRAACRACFIGGATRTLEDPGKGHPAEERLYIHVLRTCESLIENRPFYMLIQRQLLEVGNEGVREFVEGSFDESFKGLLSILRKVDPKRPPMNVAASIYALVYGSARLFPLWESTPAVDFPISHSPKQLALHVLSTLLPKIDWSKYAA